MSHKNPETEYFARQDAEKLRQLAAKKRSELAQAEREELRKRHYMRCPKCGMELDTISLRGVQVDRCFACHGTWLDEGELDLLAGKEDGFLQRLASFFRDNGKDKS